MSDNEDTSGATPEAQEAIKRKLEELRVEHRDLDDVILVPDIIA